MINFDESDEFNDYQPYTTSSDARLLTLMIKLKSGETVFFPYSYFSPTKLANTKKKRAYTLNLVGGGLDLVLHLKNFNESAYDDFCAALAKHQIEKITEFDGDSSEIDYPIFSKIEEVD